MNTAIYAYTLQQAVDDGVLVEVFKDQWPTLSGGKPIVATAHIAERFSLAALQEIWNAFVAWKNRPYAPDDEVFVTKMNGEAVWVMEDASVFTILFPADY